MRQVNELEFYNKKMSTFIQNQLELNKQLILYTNDFSQQNVAFL